MGFEYCPLGKIEITDFTGKKLTGEDLGITLKKIVERYKFDKDFYYFDLLGYFEEIIETGACDLQSYISASNFIRSSCLLSILLPAYKLSVSLGHDSLFRVNYELVNGFINHFVSSFCSNGEEIKKLHPLVLRETPVTEINLTSITDYDCWHEDEMTIKLTNSRAREDFVQKNYL